MNNSDIKHLPAILETKLIRNDELAATEWVKGLPAADQPGAIAALAEQLAKKKASKSAEWVLQFTPEQRKEALPIIFGKFLDLKWAGSIAKAWSLSNATDFLLKLTKEERGGYVYRIGWNLGVNDDIKEADKLAEKLSLEERDRLRAGIAVGQLLSKNGKYAHLDVDESKNTALKLASTKLKDETLLAIFYTYKESAHYYDPTKALEIALALSPGETRDKLIEEFTPAPRKPPGTPRFPRLMAGLQRLHFGGKHAETAEQTQEATQER